MPEKTLQLVAQLRATDLSAAAWTLTDLFGFKAEAGYRDVRGLPDTTDSLRLRRLDQVIELVRAEAGTPLGHGAFDHLALKARDVDAVVMALRAKWARLDPEVTPDGAIDLPMFWSRGVRIAFALGPEDARIEYCQHFSDPPGDSGQTVNPGGHDHFGVRCRDVEEATAFYAGFGFAPEADVSIETPDGDIAIRFVRLGSYLLEIASTPATRAPGAGFAENALWSRIIIECEDEARVETGPNGEVVEIRKTAPDAAFHFAAEDLQ